MSEINIRPTQVEDVNSIYNLVPQLSPLTPHTRYTYWNLFTHFGNSCFIATDQDHTVGFITSHPTAIPKAEWFIWQVGIMPEYRGKGIVDELQNRVIDVAEKSGAIALHTSIETDNPCSYGAFSRMATRIGTVMEEVDRFNLDLENTSAVPEILYRIPLQVNKLHK